MYFSGQNAADELVGFQRGSQHGEWFVGFADRFRHIRQNQFKQRGKVFLFVVHVLDGPAVASRSVQNREVELFVTGVEADKEVKDFVQNLVDACVGLVCLIDDDNRFEADF